MSTYLFDFDGTLVDSMTQWGNKVLLVLEKAGITPPKGILKLLTPLGDIGSMRYYREQMGVTMTDQEMLAIMDAYAYPEYSERIPAKPYVKETLLRLKAQGHRLSVLTASPHRMLDVCLQRLELYDLFDRVWSCEDFHMTKAQPEIYCAAAKELGVAVTDCIFVDDNIVAVKTAMEAGMQAVAVHDPSAQAFEEELRRIAPRYIEDFRQL